jgi:predicted hydrocarbon binding protein
MSAEPQSPRQWILTLADFNASSREFCRLLAGYFSELAELAGAANVDVRKQSCRLDGAADCRWRLTWS